MRSILLHIHEDACLDARIQVAFDLARAFDAAESGGAILFLDESDDLFGRRDEIARHDGPVVLGVRSIRSIPPELRTSLVVVKAPRSRWWHSRR